VSLPVVTVVTFAVPGRLPPAGLRELLEATAPAYRRVPGLRRKYFIGAPARGGGIYEWDNRRAAEAFHDAAWYARLTQQYGSAPSVDWYELPAIVDNVIGAIDIHVPDAP